MESKAFVLLLKLLADETRIRIIHLLTAQELTVSDLCAVLEMSQPSVSRHLIKLRLSGIVNDVRQGNFVYYSLNEENQEYMTIIHPIIKQFMTLELPQNDLESATSLQTDQEN